MIFLIHIQGYDSGIKFKIYIPLHMHFISICGFEISKLRQIIYPICTQWVYLGQKYTHTTLFTAWVNPYD